MEEINIKELEEVVRSIRLNSGVDFSDYATASLRRRVLRTMQVRRLSGVDSLLEWIAKSKDHARIMVDDITVNTTEMFRDPGFWKVLRSHVLPELKGKELIRIWHAACSTGEEVYSMAIMLKEEGLYDRCRIVASDINEGAMDLARKGAYPLRSMELNNSNYKNYKGEGTLESWYEKKGGEAQFDVDLLKAVRFRKYNLAEDAAFSSFDLVLCRNVMIYFTATLQEKVIEKIYQSMYTGSFLGIGMKESLQWSRRARAFSALSVDEKIFKKVNH